MAGPFDLTKGGPGIPGAHFPAARVVEAQIDLRTQTLGSAEIAYALNVKAGTWVQCLGVNCQVAEGATLTIDVGDGSDADGFIDGADMNTVGWTGAVRSLVEATPNTFTGYSFGKLYTADDTIDVTSNNAAANAAVFTLYFLVIPLFGNAVPAA